VTKQETFDIVARHLLTQNAKAWGQYTCSVGEPTNGCVYRDADGRKCAAGCLIPDDVYSPSLEGELADGRVMRAILIDHGHEPGFVRALQFVHDDYVTDDWPHRLRHTADLHGLSAAVVDEVLREREAKTAGDPP
jgi:hypothetical protein